MGRIPATNTAAAETAGAKEMDVKRDYLSSGHRTLMAYPDTQLDARLLVAEYRFHPARKWRFDIAAPDAKVAMEIDGGLFVRGGHSRGKQIMSDHEKSNAAQIMGWIVLRCTPQQWDSGEAMRTMAEAIDVREKGIST